MDTNEQFDFGELGADWWLKTATQIGASERHAKFAAAKHRGATNTDAARQAGFGGGSEGSVRSEGYRLFRSNKVNQLLALATAEAGGGYDGTLSRTEARQILTQLARGSDPQVRIKAIESLGKIDTQAGANVDVAKMLPPADMLATVLVCCDRNIYRPEIWPLLWMEAVLSQDVWWSPLIRQMAPYLKQHCPQLWAEARKNLAEHRPDDLQALEGGPVLSAEAIFEITARNMAELFVVLDPASDPEDRKRAYDDLKDAGLLEASFKGPDTSGQPNETSYAH